jgi:hypothetical protein
MAQVLGYEIDLLRLYFRVCLSHAQKSAISLPHPEGDGCVSPRGPFLEWPNNTEQCFHIVR